MPRILFYIRFIGNGAVLAGVSARAGPRRRADAPFPRSKESVGNAGPERLSTENTDASLVILPTAGTPLWHLADFRHFFETREKTKIRTKPFRTGRATATRRRRQAEARLAFHCAHCVGERFSEPPPRLVPGRRASCVDRVPSASRKSCRDHSEPKPTRCEYFQTVVVPIKMSTYLDLYRIPIPLYQPKIPWSNNSRTEITVTLRALRQRLRSPESEKTLFTVVICGE
jgi:hypothetical protein